MFQLKPEGTMINKMWLP